MPQSQVNEKDGPDGLIKELREQLSLKKLQELTVMLLDIKKQNRRQDLRELYEKVFGPASSENPPDNKMFFRLIHHLHPDRLAALQQEITRAAKTGDRKKLEFYRTLFSLAPAGRLPGHTPRPRHDPARYEWEYTEEYYSYGEDFGDDDGGYDQDFDQSYHRNDTDCQDDFIHDDPEEMDFYKAVKISLLGALNLDLGMADLASLSGELDLSAMGLQDLDGLEYCRGLTGLNLAENEIANIYSIRELSYLRELYLERNHISDIEALRGLDHLELLDLAFNDIEDLTPLLSLPALKFVNLMGNPIQNRDVINRLKDQGIEVLD